MGLFDRLMQPQSAPRRLDEFYPPDYSKLKRGQFRQDTPQMREYAANVPVDVGRGTFAGLFGLTSDILNFAPAYSPMPMEQFGDYNYAPSQKVPYGSEYFLENLPLAPAADNPLGRVAGQLGSFAPMVPVQAARLAGKGAAATAKFVAPKAGQLAEGYMQRMGMMPSVVPAEGGLLTPSVKPQAPVSDLGFYSAAEQAALNLPRNKGTGQAFLNDLMKAPDVKKDELAWTGLDDFLKDKPNVTKQEVQDFIANNKVDLQEVQLFGDPNKTRPFVEWSPSDKTYLVYGDDEVPIATFNTAIDAQKFVDQNYGKPTQYSNYQLAGGENYREILLKMPNQWDKPRAAQVANEERIKALRQEMYGTSGTNEIRSEISRLQNENTALQKQISEAPIYKSSHFDEPNILAHMRVNDRIDADGKKMLLVEELQSDWHQAGKLEGYKTKARKVTEEQKQEFKKLNSIDDGDRTGQMNERLDELESLIAGELQGVPDAPFKDTWHQLALKRALKYAADNGYERVGLTTGKQQAERYDLSKQIKTLIYSEPDADGLRRVEAITPSGDRVLGKKYTENQISENVGKEIAEKIINNTGEFDKRTNTYSMTGLDLSVGGEGMKKYYDEIYPAFLAKQGKKYNSKTGETTINIPPKTSNSWAYFRNWFAENHSNVGGSSTALANWERGASNNYVKEFEKFRKTSTQSENIRYIDISPEMKSGVSKGQPMFAAAPIAGVGLGAGQQQQPADILTNELDYPSNPMYTDPFGYSIR